MSLTEMSLSDVVKRQYEFKLRAFLGVFSSMAGVQLISLLFSLGGVTSVGTGTSSGMYINISYYSADMVVVFTMIWIFMTGILITTKAVRYDDFTFVSNRLSSNLANILFLLTASAIGGAAAVTAGFLLKIIAFFFGDIQYGLGNSFLEAPAEFFIGLAAAILYMILFASLGYLTGMIVQVNKIFIFLLPTLITGIVVYLGIRNEELATAILDFIFAESSLFLFAVKTLLLSTLFFTGSIVLSNRMEVWK
ncbi:hypothetical protein QNH23_14710 [Siminovitchia fortis]|uniref:Uncharacterized protein n=1 Tax=Siminovitchia fortis TaxID=254758 RepID=A0A443J0Y7_9BACI|nr:hypothetical protein [Siminovitchia fortis]RWR14013.1 hypothetical protein D4N35_003725 [Siminovitchia fortis]WHY81138.1 hypothetical protein QNH23_14710 [Siminovitchia fortis]